jgi:hypothetical protein
MDPTMTRLDRAFLLMTLLALLGLPAAAGELTLSWPEMDDDLTVGYNVYVGTAPGSYGRVEDAGEATRLTVTDLQDEQVYYFAVKAYDARGQESPEFSPEVVSLPRPRIESIDPPALMTGEATYVTLRGANFDPEIQVRVLDGRLSLRSAVSAGAGTVTLLLEASPSDEAEESIALEASAFTLINPGRKAPEFFEVHPETVDLDGSGWVDDSDLEAIRRAYGSRAGDETYRSATDLNGDGRVDGADLDRVMQRLETAAVHRPAAPMTDASTETGDSEKESTEDDLE